MKQLREQAKDGTLAEVLQLPVISWHVKTDSNPVLRNRRETGSGDWSDGNDGDYGYDDDYEDNYDDEEGEETDDNNEQIQPTYLPEHHPHRHHHGEETIGWKVS